MECLLFYHRWTNFDGEINGQELVEQINQISVVTLAGIFFQKMSFTI